MKEESYIIVDWCNNIMFDGLKFETFEDGWDFIYDNIEDKDCSYDDVFVVLENSLH